MYGCYQAAECLVTAGRIRREYPSIAALSPQLVISLERSVRPTSTFPFTIYSNASRVATSTFGQRSYHPIYLSSSHSPGSTFLVSILPTTKMLQCQDHHQVPTQCSHSELELNTFARLPGETKSSASTASGLCPRVTCTCDVTQIRAYLLECTPWK